MNIKNKKSKLIISICILIICLFLQTIITNAASTKPTSMSLNTSKKTIDVESTYAIKVKSVKPRNASMTVSYKSSNTKVATVSSKGIVNGKKEGKVKITVQSKKNKKLKRTVSITVKRLRPYSLSLNTNTLNLKIGKTYKLTPIVKASSPVIFNSSNSKVALIDKYGKITAKKDGITIITVKTTKKSYKNKVLQKTCKVNVSHNHKYLISKTINATCNKDGYQEYQCKNCKNIKKNNLNKKGHDYRLIQQKNATCEEDGCILYKCNNCQEKKEEILPKLGHNFKYTETVESTCESDGYKLYICSNCNENKKSIIEKLGHNYNKIEHKNSTCKEHGYDLYQCERCNGTRKEILPLTDHNYEKIKEDLQYIYYKCKNCAEEKREYNDKEYIIDLGDGKTDTIIGHYDLDMPKEMLDICNEKRDLFDVNKLTMVNNNTKLQKYANIRATEIAYYYTTTHYRPNGKYVLDSEDMIGIDAENITPGSNVQIACKNLFSSPMHNETIVSNRYRSIAISTFCRKKADGTYNHLFVQLFSTGKADWWNTNL